MLERKMQATQIKVKNLQDLKEKTPRILELIGDKKVVLLKGQLGAGKTQLVYEICSHLGFGHEVSSPTFSLINEYHSPDGLQLFHIDLYRLESTEEAINIGIEDYMSGQYPCFIEWPEIIEPLLSLSFVTIEIIQIEENQRIINIY